jgi:hypothetical protein
MKRTGFAPKFPPRPMKVYEVHTPIVRAAAVAVHDGKARMVVPVPKFPYVRDERLRDMCRAMACQHCGRSGPDAGVTWAHSNWAIHGKGKSIKASDVYVAALCAMCHWMLDQGRAWSEEHKLLVWTTAHVKTIATAMREGAWPVGIPIPHLTEGA